MIDFDLYLVTDPELGDPVAATRAALAAGPRGRVAVQVRGKSLPARDLLELARALRGPTRDAGAKLLVNGRPDLARLADADGVHLPEATLTPAEARDVLGAAAMVGVSCHDARGLREAEEGHATFAVLGPFEISPDKGAPIALARFADLVAGTTLPVLALGGIRATNVPEALAAGARGVAVIRAVYSAADPADATRALIAALDSAHAAKR